jgi:hypothetical protein
VNVQPLDRLLDVIADSIAVTDDEDRAALHRTAEVLRNRLTGVRSPVVLLVRVLDADPLTDAVANLQLDVTELWGHLTTIGDNLTDLLAELRHRAATAEPVGAQP